MFLSVFPSVGHVDARFFKYKTLECRDFVLFTLMFLTPKIMSGA